MSSTAEEKLCDEEGKTQRTSLFPKDQDTEEELFKDSDYYKRNLLPVDRGWAWAVCFGGFVVSFNFGLQSQSMAILFLEVIELLDTNLTTASLVFVFYILCAGLMSPITTNIIVPKVGERCVICVAGLVFSLTSIGFYLSPNIEVFLCCTAVKGVATGSMFVPSISLLRHYFHKRRSIAQIIARTGASFSGIVMPTLIRMMKNEFGVRGTFLIIAALQLHMVLGGLLLRPVESYKFKPDLPPLKKKGKKERKDKVMAESKQSGDGKGEETVTGLNKNDIEMSNLEKDNNGLKREEETERATLLETHVSASSNGSKDSQSQQIERDQPVRLHFSDTDEAKIRPRTHSMASYSCAEESAVALSVMGDGDEAHETEETPGCGKYIFCRLLSFHMVLVFAIIGAGDIYLRNYIPTIAVSQGATLDQTAIMLTIVGVLDLTSRLSVGFLGDTHWLRPSQIVAISHAALGVICHLTRFLNTFPLLILMTGYIALFLGTRICMMPMICIEVVGVELMPLALSFLATMGTFSAAAMNPVLSAVAEHFGSFIPVMHILGICFFLSASTLFVLPIIQKIDKRRGNKAV